MRFFRFICLILILPGFLLAQLTDVDALSRDLDLSILDETAETSDETAVGDVPASHLFINLDLIEIPALPVRLLEDFQDERGLYTFTLPAATYIVIANPPRVDHAYKFLAETLSAHCLATAFPLKWVLHADGNFSLALRLVDTPEEGLPLGVGLSPIPEMHFAGVIADIQLMRKDHPPVLEAFTRLQQAAIDAKIPLDRSEFYFFPTSPGKVLFALRVINKNRIDN
jgi:hypothetical protein